MNGQHTDEQREPRYVSSDWSIAVWAILKMGTAE